jgi:hypothetical protein
MPTTAIPNPTDLQNQALDGIRQSQQAILEAARAWGEAAQGASTSLPSIPTPPALEGAPSPAQLVESSFEFVEKLLASQREFTQELLAAVSPDTGKQAGPAATKPAAATAAATKPTATKPAARKATPKKAG